MACLIVPVFFYFKAIEVVLGKQEDFSTYKRKGEANFGWNCIPGGGGVLPYMGYICMCGPKGYGFSAVLVINRVSILADFGHFGHN